MKKSGITKTLYFEVVHAVDLVIFLGTCTFKLDDAIKILIYKYSAY